MTTCFASRFSFFVGVVKITALSHSMKRMPLHCGRQLTKNNINRIKSYRKYCKHNIIPSVCSMAAVVWNAGVNSIVFSDQQQNKSRRKVKLCLS